MLATLKISAWTTMLVGLVASSLLAPHPVVLLPYPLFFFVFRLAQSLGDWGLSLFVTVLCVGWNVWVCLDARYIHLSTLNLNPLLVALIETALAGAVIGELLWARRRRTRSALKPSSADMD